VRVFVDGKWWLVFMKTVFVVVEPDEASRRPRPLRRPTQVFAEPICGGPRPLRRPEGFVEPTG